MIFVDWLGVLFGRWRGLGRFGRGSLVGVGLNFGVIERSVVVVAGVAAVGELDFDAGKVVEADDKLD